MRRAQSQLGELSWMKKGDALVSAWVHKHCFILSSFEKPETRRQWKLSHAQRSIWPTPFHTLTSCQSQKPPQFSVSPKRIFSAPRCKKANDLNAQITQNLSNLFSSSSPPSPWLSQIKSHHQCLWKPNEDSSYVHAPGGTLLLYW